MASFEDDVWNVRRLLSSPFSSGVAHVSIGDRMAARRECKSEPDGEGSRGQVRLSEKPWQGAPCLYDIHSTA